MEEDELEISDRFTDELPSEEELRVLLHSSRLVLQGGWFGKRGLERIPNLDQFKEINRLFIVRIMRILLSNRRLKFRLLFIMTSVLLRELEKEKQ